MIRLLKNTPLILFIITSIIYASVFIPPEIFWPAGIAVYGILPCIILNILLLFFLILRKKKSFLWPLLGLLLGTFFIKITFHLNVTGEIHPERQYVDIVSFNAQNFKMGHKNSEISKEIIQWVVNDTASIKCIQEYNTNTQWPEFDADVTRQIIANDYEAFTYTPLIDNDGCHRGLAIFSHYPIINQGILLFNEESANNCIYIDVKVSEDTIRIYNVHLSSMHIPLYAYKDPNNYDRKLKRLILKLKNGAIKRSNEIKLLLKHTSGCPYPFIICGDFNDIPYSNNYMKLRRHYINSFEKAGNGFGFSFNHKLFFLRIDHHFVSDGMTPLLYRIDRKMKESDHFPTRGIYQIP